MSRSNPNNYVKFPMNFPVGLGYSPAGGPPGGGWSYTPGPGFFGRQPMDSLLPRLSGPGSSPGRRSFGYPLMNNANYNLNERMFPLYPVGMGNTPGGDGGVWMQSGPVNFNTYWGFGRKIRTNLRRSRNRRSRSRRSRSSRSRSRSISRRNSRRNSRRGRRSRRNSRSRRSRRKSDNRWRLALIKAIKSENKNKLITALDNFDQSLGWNGASHPLYKKGIKMLEKI